MASETTPTQESPEDRAVGRQPGGQGHDVAPRELGTAAGRIALAPRCPRYKSLDIWRGVACLFVVVVHSVCYARDPSQPRTPADLVVDVLEQLGLGVWMFFVISGYCISATVDATRIKGRPISTYFFRRFRRIYPPYWIFLAGAVAFVSLLNPVLFSDPHNLIRQAQSMSVWQWLGNLTLTETWRHHVIGDAQGLFAGHIWTLCYEEQFYLVAGVMLLLCPKRFFLAAIVVSIGTVAVRLASKVFGLATTGFFFDGRWLLFALGILVYYWVNYAQRRGRVISVAFLALMALAILIAPIQLPNKIEYGTGVLFALMLVGLHRWDVGIASARLLKPLAICGTMCYSLYLIHWPLVLAISHALYRNGLVGPMNHLLITLPLCVAASVAVGWTFHLFVERRFLNAP